MLVNGQSWTAEGRVGAGHPRVLGRGRRRDRAGGDPRYLVVEDCGELINPAIVDGQVRGGVAQGVGAVLYEKSTYDDDGKFLAGTFMDYLIPTSMEIPEIEIHHVETPSNIAANYRGVGGGRHDRRAGGGHQRHRGRPRGVRRNHHRTAPTPDPDPRARRRDSCSTLTLAYRVISRRSRLTLRVR